MDLNPERNAEIVRLRQAGIGPREIARRLGVSPGVIAGVMTRKGMTIHPGAKHFSRNERMAACELSYLYDRRIAAEEYGVNIGTITKWRSKFNKIRNRKCPV